MADDPSLDRASSESGAPTHAGAWLVVALLGYAGFAMLAWLIASGVQIPFDQQAFDTIHGWAAFDPIWSLLSDSANYPLIVIGVAIVAWLLYRRRFREAFIVIVVLAAATAGSEAVKELVHRPRPPGSDPRVLGVVYSFPSGHTLEATTIYGIIALKVWRGRRPRWVRVAVAIVLALIVAAVGIARIAIGAHYPSDVLAGLLVGLGDLGVYAWFTRSDVAEHGRDREHVKTPDARAT